MQRENVFRKTITIQSSPSTVWKALTTSELMKPWMSETEIDIITTWQVGSPMIIRGKLSRIAFENNGVVLQFETDKILQYSHLSSLSKIPNEPQNYSIVEFRLISIEDQTELTVTVSNFPTEVIYKHLAFYWNITPGILKKQIEERGL